MKHALLITLVISAPALASGNPLETNEQARQRQSAENYETYQKQKRQGGMMPPTYARPLGDPEQRGVERPGYRDHRQSPRINRE